MQKTALVIGSLLLLTSFHSGAQARRSLRNQGATVNTSANTVAETNPGQNTTDGAPVVLIGTIEGTTTCREKILRS